MHGLVVFLQFQAGINGLRWFIYLVIAMSLKLLGYLTYLYKHLMLANEGKTQLQTKMAFEQRKGHFLNRKAHPAAGMLA